MPDKSVLAAKDKLGAIREKMKRKVISNQEAKENFLRSGNVFLKDPLLF
ncbi:MAG: hypothetical protein V1869_02830 [Candidatus Omnitrophota bacterium]